MRIFSSGTPSSSAAICARAVTMPWPSSTLPVVTEILPSASKRTRFSADIEDRAPHAVVRAAAAEVAVQGLPDLGFAGRFLSREKLDGAHDDAAHAVSALRGLMALERPLHGMRAAQTFDGGHFPSGDERHRQVARGHCAA